MTKKVTITLEEEGSITIRTRVWSTMFNDYTWISESVILNGKGKSHTVHVHAFQEIMITED